MNIILQNENGYSITIDSRSDSACLTDYPDFGETSCDFKTARIPGIPGETCLSALMSPRDITIKFEARKINERRISQTLSPMSEITGIINCRKVFKGIAKSSLKAERKHEIMPPVYTVQIRMFDPCFYKLNGLVTVPFSNNGGTLYENGNYNYQAITIFNEGDLPCPVYVNMTPVTIDGAAGLFTHAEWNNGSPKYIGYRLKTSRDIGTFLYLSSDIKDENALIDYENFSSFTPITLTPGKNTIYALNIKGTLEFNPAFLSAEEDF